MAPYYTKELISLTPNDTVRAAALYGITSTTTTTAVGGVVINLTSNVTSTVTAAVASLSVSTTNPTVSTLVVVPAGGYFSYDEVKAGTVPGMDVSHKENYLDDVTFRENFGMERVAFAALPKWKRDEKKKAVGLF